MFANDKNYRKVRAIVILEVNIKAHHIVFEI